MNNKKTIIALALIALIGIIGGTYAYFTSTAILENEFIAGIYATKVTEVFESPDNWTPGTTTPKVVNVTNNGNVDVAVRATITEKWTSANGNLLSNTRDDEAIAQFEVGSNWQKASDEKYYYKEILKPGQTTSSFIDSVTFNPNFSLEEGSDIQCIPVIEEGKTLVNCVSLPTGYAGAKYILEITIETIQADQKWGYTKFKYEVGDVITIEQESFNVISDNGDTITMLAQYNLGTNYRQTKTQNGVTFSDDIGWEYVPGPKEIDIQAYDGETKTYINEYVAYLKETTGDENINGTLMTLSQLKDLGCNINDDYSQSDGVAVCASSENISWLANGQRWWTRSACPIGSNRIWRLNASGHLYNNFNYDFIPVRPVITISRDSLAQFN